MAIDLDVNQTNAFSITNNQGRAYPGASQLIFGSDYSGRDFITPMARFAFYDSYGNYPGDAPIIYIKMPGTFNTTSVQNWQESASIFGNPQSGNLSGFMEALNVVGPSAASALQAQFLRGVAGLTGMIASAGLQGRNQIEFITRRFLNNFQQLIYQGPTFRRFQLPFVMKPTSEDEAIQMMAIVHTFKTASMPNAGFTTEQDINTIQRGISAGSGMGLVESTQELTDEQKQQIGILDAQRDVDTILANDFVNYTGDVLTFAYPDMCRFDIILDKPGTDIDETTSEPIFRSDTCVIESVAVDYGQSKLQFFEKASDGLYYPAEVTMTLSLRETRLQTAGDAAITYNNSQTIF